MKKQAPPTLKDYLTRYIQGGKVLDLYSEYRKKKGLTVGGLVTQDDMKASIKETRKLMKEMDWSDGPESERRRYSKKVKAVFQTLGIDDAVFKKGKKYEMTESFTYLIRYILDEEYGVTDRLIHGRLHEISDRQYEFIFSFTEAAIRNGPAPEEQKQAEKEKLMDFLAKEKIWAIWPEYYENETVQKILSHVREVIPTDTIGDLDWELIVEGVYKRLFECGDLVINHTENKTYAPGSILTSQIVRKGKQNCNV